MTMKQIVLSVAIASICGSTAAMAQQEVRTHHIPATVGAGCSGLSWARSWNAAGPTPLTVTAVDSSAPTGRVGIEAGDVVVSMNGVPAERLPIEFSVAPGDTVRLRVLQGDVGRDVVFVAGRIVAHRRDGISTLACEGPAPSTPASIESMAKRVLALPRDVA
jgi:hypothetical protein